MRWTNGFRVLLGGAALSCLVACHHDVRNQPPDAALPIDDGVFVMRLVGSLEAQATGDRKPAQYLPLSGIVAVSDPWLRRNVTMIDDDNASYKGYVLRVTAEGTRYEASLVPDKRGCGLAFFDDERILIYTGRGLGCGAAPEVVESPTLTLEDGVNLMRRLADVEVNPFRFDFRPLADLLTTRYNESPGLKSDITLIDNENGSFKNYAVRVAAQGAQFEASLVPDKRGCGRAFFIDERILIYTGNAIGCHEKR